MTAKIDSKELEYTVVRALAVDTPSGAKILPSPHGRFFMAICRECGFGAVTETEENAVHCLLASVLPGESHAHDGRTAHMQVEPALIDYIYEAYSLEVGNA